MGCYRVILHLKALRTNRGPTFTFSVPSRPSQLTAGSRTSRAAWGILVSWTEVSRAPSTHCCNAYPSPVTGSQPSLTWKPSPPQPGFDPVVMSVKTSGCAYYRRLVNTNTARRGGGRATHQHLMHKANGPLAHREPLLVDQRQDGTPNRRRHRRPVHPVREPAEDDPEILPNGRHVRVAPPDYIEQLARLGLDLAVIPPRSVHVPPAGDIGPLQVAAHVLLLPGRPREDVGEAAARGEAARRRLDEPGPALAALLLHQRRRPDAEHVGAVPHRPRRVHVPARAEAAAARVEARPAHAKVAARLDDRHALQGELHDLEALPAHVVGRPRVLGAAVADRDDVGGPVRPAHERPVVPAVDRRRVGVGVLRVAAEPVGAVAREVEGVEGTVGLVKGVEECYPQVEVLGFPW